MLRRLLLLLTSLLLLPLLLLLPFLPLCTCSVVMLGEPGVGKSSIIHGLAQRLAVGDVPGSLKESRLLGLELGLLMAGEAGSL
jgi:hypothetical protein